MIDTTAQNALKNSMYNFIGFLLPIIILVIFTPIIISKLGVKEYGIFIFLNTILTFLGLLDLGIGIATNKHAIEYYSTHQIDRLKRLLGSMNSIYLLQAFVYLFVCIIIGSVMQVFFIKETTQVNYFILLSIIGLTGFVGTIFANFTNSFMITQRYDLQLKISSFFLLLSNISILILASFGYKLIPILSAQLIITLLGSLTYYIMARKTFIHLELKYLWDKAELIKNYKFAIPVAFNNLANSSLVHFDKLLIPIFLGAAPLTYYSVPGSVATKISSISGTFSSLLFPITVNLHSLNNHEQIKRVYIRSIRLITILSSAIALSIIFTADKILLYWLGKSFAEQSVTVLILLVLTNFVLAIFSPLSNLLMATNRMKFLTMSSFAMAGVNIITLFIFLPKYGITGAAISYLISVLFIFFIFYYSEKKYFNIDKNIHLKTLLKIISTAIPFYFIIKFLIYPLIINFLTLAVIGPFCVLLFLLLYKLFGFVEVEDWNDFKLFLSTFLKRLKFTKHA
jgi:O-antigen/teichoic acid export membrane protein